MKMKYLFMASLTALVCACQQQPSTQDNQRMNHDDQNFQQRRQQQQQRPNGNRPNNGCCDASKAAESIQATVEAPKVEKSE